MWHIFPVLAGFLSLRPFVNTAPGAVYCWDWSCPFVGFGARHDGYRCIIRIVLHKDAMWNPVCLHQNTMGRGVLPSLFTSECYGRGVSSGLLTSVRHEASVFLLLNGMGNYITCWCKPTGCYTSTLHGLYQTLKGQVHLQTGTESWHFHSEIISRPPRRSPLVVPEDQFWMR